MWCQEILRKLYSGSLCDICVRVARLPRRRCQTWFDIALRRWESICWDIGSPSAVRVGWRLSLRRVGKRERLSSAVMHLFVLWVTSAPGTAEITVQMAKDLYCHYWAIFCLLWGMKSPPVDLPRTSFGQYSLQKSPQKTTTRWPITAHLRKAIKSAFMYICKAPLKHGLMITQNPSVTVGGSKAVMMMNRHFQSKPHCSKSALGARLLIKL